MGEGFVGIVHPSKIYNIMSIGAPTLYIGPEPSHITDIASQNNGRKFFLTRHGDVSAVIASILDSARNQLSYASNGGDESFSKQTLLPQITKLLESTPHTPAAISEAAVPKSA
jgi:hypothetical protein